MSLTPKQEKFCLAYIEANNASDAYRAVYSAAKMKEEAIWVEASKLLSNPKVSLRIQELRVAIAEKTIITEARVIEEAARIGLLDPAKMVDESGALLPLHKMPPEVRAAISSIKVSEEKVDGVVIGVIKEVKLWDKNSALEKIMKHLGMFERDNKQKAGIFENVPIGTLRIIEEKLRGLQRPGLAGQSSSGSSSRFTH